MKDPSRIPQVLAQLQRVWEAQPDLTLPTLFGMLGNRGIGWGNTDEDLVEALLTLYRENPGEVRGYAAACAPMSEEVVRGRFLVETESPAFRVTVDPYRVSVRRINREQPAPQPGVWEFEKLRRCRSGEPLVITDTEGVEHRFGVVVRITLLNENPTAEIESLTGVRRRKLGDKTYQLIFDDGDTALLNHGLELYQSSRRTVEQRSVKWDQLISATPGQTFKVQETGSGAVMELGMLEKIIPLEG
ncbi:hypothetical protein [Corynebacterium crudilactis]|uniref:Uncharacterized protein n=1 Tax=Corynebacterium crudilactis TaxID=1652495 RepID=A0A172QR84_9CORY|nr:hypothetical protein [Corynebacterium crudilactis]ANE03205.1 hypothetical protein ccrud_02595 [Corynebacterium crudilactis]